MIRPASIVAVLFLLFILVVPAPAQKTGTGPAKKGPHPAAQGEFQNLAKRADAARQADRVEEAIDLYKKALKLNPRWQEGWWYLGTLDYDSDRYPEAVSALRNLVVLSPKMGPAWALLGLSEYEAKDYKNSILHLQRGRYLGLAANDEMVNVTRYHEALLMNVFGEFESATELLSSLVSRGVVSEDVRVALGLATLRVPLLPSQVDPSKDALIHAAGEVAAQVAKNDFDQAIQGYQQLLKDFPGTPFLHYAFGIALVMTSRYEDAEREFRAELKTTPDSALSYMQLAFLELRLNHFKEASALAETAVRLAPNAFPAHYLLGRAYLELGRTNEAIQQLEAARRLGPYSPEVRYNLARAYTRAKRNDDAVRERKEFARLNAASSREQGAAGESYRTSSERGTLGPHELSGPAAPPPK